MTTKVEPTVEKWDTSAKPDQTVVMITNSIFNAIGWEKHYTVKERQALNDVVDEIVAHSLQEAKAEERREMLSLLTVILTHSSMHSTHNKYCASCDLKKAIDEFLSSKSGLSTLNTKENK